jgi:ribosome recycling factor
MDKLKDDLSKLRAGQADPGLLEGLSVVVDKAAGTTAPLKDVAHVVTRGRGLAVTVYEATVRILFLPSFPARIFGRG